MEIPYSPENPLIAHRDEKKMVIMSFAKRIIMTAAISDAIVTATRERQVPWLVSGEDSIISFPVKFMIEALGGKIVSLQSDGRGYHSATGALLEDSPDSTHNVAGYDRPPEDILNFSISIHYSARSNLVLGGIINVMMDELAPGENLTWGPYEPFLIRWERERYTEYCRSKMPGPIRTFFASSSGALQMTSVVRRTNRGVEETVSGVAHLARYSGLPIDDRLQMMSTTANGILKKVATHEKMPLLGQVGVLKGFSDLWYRPALYRPLLPLAVLIGPQATHVLQHDLANLGSAVCRESLGPRRISSTLIDLYGSEGDPWKTVNTILSLLDKENLRTAFGISEADTRGV